MADVVEQAKGKVRAWVETHRHAVLYDEESSSLMDVTSGKTVHLPWREVKAFEENGWGGAIDAATQQYLDNLVHLAEQLHIRAPQPELQP